MSWLWIVIALIATQVTSATHNVYEAAEAIASGQLHVVESALVAQPAPPPEPAPPPLPPLTEIQAQFLDGYRAGGGDPAWEGHWVADVIPCESEWTPNAESSFWGLAQFHPGTWTQARCSPEADWRSPWEQGCAVANWMSQIAPDYGTTAGWPWCWHVWN